MANVDAQTGASAWWDAGYTGAGVDVAVIDTGVTPVPALSDSGHGRVRPRPLARLAVARRCATSTASATAPSWPG